VEKIVRSITQQVAAMQRLWPNFQVLDQRRDSVFWIGHIVGIERPYQVSVDYRQPIDSGDVRLSFPKVRLLSPTLTPRYDATDGAPLPHVYFYRDNLLLSVLCLFDPDMGEWSHDELIAETTIPWTADWLACYETWLATGCWNCGGRHAGEPMMLETR
jgi:hypothetical protein